MAVTEATYTKTTRNQKDNRVERMLVTHSYDSCKEEMKNLISSLVTVTVWIQKEKWER